MGEVEEDEDNLEVEAFIFSALVVTFRVMVLPWGVAACLSNLQALSMADSLGSKVFKLEAEEGLGIARSPSNTSSSEVCCLGLGTLPESDLLDRFWYLPLPPPLALGSSLYSK